MIAVGLVIIVIALLIGAAGVLGGDGSTVSLDLGLATINLSAGVIFLLGAASLLLLVIGLGLIRHELRRARDRRHDRRRVSQLGHELNRAKRDAGTGDKTAVKDDEQQDRPTPI